MSPENKTAWDLYDLAEPKTKSVYQICRAHEGIAQSS